METLTEISYALQNPPSEADRMSAWGTLQVYLETNPGDAEALALYDKYRRLGPDWSGELVSRRLQS